jgi:transcriptional regulator with XRE-family HTH domain
MQAVGEKLGLSRGRVAQIEGKSNLEIQTLVRQADVLGYDVVVTLKPRNKRKTALNTHL